MITNNELVEQIKSLTACQNVPVEFVLISEKKRITYYNKVTLESVSLGCDSKIRLFVERCK
jgi:hypothetical protein